jgi:hypothetical protein
MIYGSAVANDEIVVVYTDDYAAWLDECGYPRPPVREGNRLPTPPEILAALRAVPGSELVVSDPYVHLCPRGSGRGGPYWLRLTAPGLHSSWEDGTWQGGG